MKLRNHLKIAMGVIAMIVVITGCIPEVGKPGLRQGANTPTVWDNSDPAVLVDGRTTYLYGSTNNMKMPVRKLDSFGGSAEASRKSWGSNPADAMPKRPAWVNPAKWEIWAPSVIKLGGKYVAFFAASRGGPGQQRVVDYHNDQCIGKAVSNTPMGEFIPDPTPIYCGLKAEPGSNPWGRGTIDPEVIRDNSGQLYMLVALSRTNHSIGSVKLYTNGTVAGGINATPNILFQKSLPWHDGRDNSTLSGDWFKENPSMIYEPASKSYLLFYSTGAWNTPNYLTGFARCKSAAGPCTVDTRGPFLKSGSGRSGVGGLTVFKAPDGTIKVAYASWQSGREAHNDGTGFYSRRTHFATLSISGSNQTTQSVTLQ